MLGGTQFGHSNAAGIADLLLGGRQLVLLVFGNLRHFCLCGLHGVNRLQSRIVVSLQRLKFRALCFGFGVGALIFLKNIF